MDNRSYLLKESTPGTFESLSFFSKKTGDLRLRKDNLLVSVTYKEIGEDIEGWLRPWKWLLGQKSLDFVVTKKRGNDKQVRLYLYVNMEEFSNGQNRFGSTTSSGDWSSW